MRGMIALFIVAMLPLPVLAQSPATPAEHHDRRNSTLTVTGNGEVSATPDRAVVSLGVQAHGKDAASVQNEINQKMQAILKAEKDLGINERDIQTATLSLSPVLQNRKIKMKGDDYESYEDYVVGYQGSQTIRIQLDDLSKIGPTIDAGINAGANRLDGISFELKNDADSHNAALAAAARQAQASAQALAGALDLRLDGIEDVSEGGGAIIPPRPLMRTMAAVASTPIQPGELQINATVTIRYRVSPAK